MPYVISEVVERTGVAPRTIRNYITLKLVSPPEGMGPAARYEDHHVLQILTVSRLTGRGLTFPQIAEYIKGWPLAKFRRYVKSTEPEPEPPPAPSDGAGTEKDPEALEGEPISRRALPPRRGTELKRAGEHASGGGLPDGLGGRLFRLLPHVVLWLGDDASPYEIEAAESIYARFAPSGRGQ